MGTLNLNVQLIERARSAAKEIAFETQKFIEQHTTLTVERSICRLLGIDGVSEAGIPYPNVVVEHFVHKDLLGFGAFNLVLEAAAALDLSPQEIAEQIAQGLIDFEKLPAVDPESKRALGERLVHDAVSRIKHNREQRARLVREWGENETLVYVIVATGNIYEDIVQAKAAARQGADVIAVIRTTAQSLLDYVPYGATTEGFGGTMATQENFRLMRKALDEVGAEVGRYIRLCNYCSGLCMPEIAVMGAFERLDVMLNDALYGILFRDINMKRTLIDQYFSRMVNGFAGIIISTGEDNYLTTADAFEEAHTVFASQFINEQFAKLAGLPDEQIGLGHAFEMDPELEGSFMYEWAQAQAVRQIFPKAPLKYMPPTKFMTGDIFKGVVQNALFNEVTTLTKQRVHLLGMLTEAIHTPHIADRALAIENARYIQTAFSGLADELEFKIGGRMEKRANSVLRDAVSLLEQIATEGLFNALAIGTFAGIKRRVDGGKGLEGVYRKRDTYLNPFEPIFKNEEDRLDA